jgi:hypothetical protein
VELVLLATLVDEQATLVEVVPKPPHNQTKGVPVEVVPQPCPFDLAPQPPQVEVICFTYISYICVMTCIYTL